MPFYFLARYGGPFEMARIIELGDVRHAPDPPHVEDYVFIPARTKVHRLAAAHEFWSRLEDQSRPSLRAIFGDSLDESGRHRWGTAQGQGLASLGLLRPAEPPRFYIASNPNGRRQIRVQFSDGVIRADAGVTDIRLYGDDHATPDAARLRFVGRAIDDGAEVILAVGLTRKFRSSDQLPYRHWLQVNNIHLKENPIWLLG